MPYPAAPASPSAWRLEIDENNGHASLTGFTNLIFYDAGNNVIPTTGGTAFSAGSGSDGIGAGVGNLFDSNTATSWNRSSPTNTKVGYIFPGSAPVAKIDIYTGTDMTAVLRKGRLQYSFDTTNGSDGTWTTAFEIPWEQSWPAAGTATRTWPQDLVTKVKGIRWRVTANNGARFFIMNEAQLRSGGVDICTGGRGLTSGNAGTGTTADQLFDDNNSTHFDWDSFASSPAQIPGWVGYCYPDTVAKPDDYTLREEFGTAEAWKDWKLQWTVDNVTWSDWDTQAGITWASVPLTKTFAIP